MSSSSVDIETCDICKKRFNQDDRKPKFLQCYHTYCYKCLTNIQEEKKKIAGGGVEFQCPSCRKVTRVGKKGVAALHDNCYIRVPATRKAQQDEVYISDDDCDDGDDDDDDTSTPKTSDAANNSIVKVWCNTCLKVADSECSVHDICNLELGKKRLYERLQFLLERAGIELREEISHTEPQLGHLQAAHQAWTSSLAPHLEEEMNTQSMALSVANSEIELLDNFKKLSSEDDPSNMVSAISRIEGMLTSSHSRLKAAVKQAGLMSALQMCHINIQPVSDSHDKNKDKQNLLIDVGGSNSIEEKALVYLLYYILVEKGGKTGTVNDRWRVVDRARKVKYKGGHDGEGGNESQLSNATGAVDHTNLISRAATPPGSHSAPHSTRIIVNKDIGRLNKVSQCFFDIAIDGRMRGRVVIHLRPDVAPKMCANFVALCTGELGYGYKGCRIFKAVADSHIIGGDFENNNGSGGHSIYNNKHLFIADDCGLRDEEGAVRMKGMGTDERTGGGWVGSQFHIWVKDKEFKTYTRTLVIGKVIEGLELCKLISSFRTFLNERGTYIIHNDVVIQNCGKL